MNKNTLGTMWASIGSAIICIALAGCGGDGPSAISNPDPGNNNLNTVAAFGDSITRGSECPCTPYPARLAGMIGKDVRNLGISGSKATANVNRTQQTINKHRPAFMIILYGANDVIHSRDAGSIFASIQKMVAICKQNHVVPILPPIRRPFWATGFLGTALSDSTWGFAILRARKTSALWTSKKSFPRVTTRLSRVSGIPLRTPVSTCPMGCTRTMPAPRSWRWRLLIYSEPLAAANNSAKLTRSS